MASHGRRRRHTDEEFALNRSIWIFVYYAFSGKGLSMCIFVLPGASQKEEKGIWRRAGHNNGCDAHVYAEAAEKLDFSQFEERRAAYDMRVPVS